MASRVFRGEDTYRRPEATKCSVWLRLVLPSHQPVTHYTHYESRAGVAVVVDEWVADMDGCRRQSGVCCLFV